MDYNDTWISSRDDLQAMLFLDDCKKFAKIMSQVCSILGNKVVKSESAYSCHEIKFTNGTSIHSISSSVDAQAGKRGTRILDEFALHN
jgi:phage FluMu gp28-like protein